VREDCIAVTKKCILLLIGAAFITQECAALDRLSDCQFKLHVILHDYFRNAKRRKKKGYDKDGNLSRIKETFFPYYCSIRFLFFPDKNHYK